MLGPQDRICSQQPAASSQQLTSLKVRVKEKNKGDAPRADLFERAGQLRDFRARKILRRPTDSIEALPCSEGPCIFRVSTGWPGTRVSI